MNPHQLFELFFDNKVVTYLCEQSKIYGASKHNFVFCGTLEEFCVFLANLLILAYTYLPWRHRYWEKETNVFNCAFADMLPRNHFEEILRYSHLVDNAKLTADDKIANLRLLFNLMNERVLNAFQFDEQLYLNL